MPADPTVSVLSDYEMMSRAAADLVARIATRSVEERGRFTVALTGGPEPRRLYELLAGPMADLLPWRRMQVFWGDERYVPHDDEESNFGLARETLFRQIDLPNEQLHPIPTTDLSHEEAAATYEETLREVLGEEAPVMDLILLGLGPDGHVASIFPEDDFGEADADSWVRAVTAPPRHTPRQRITLTLPVLNAARHVLFLVSGDEKRDAVRAVLDERDESRPATHLRPRGACHWMLDEAARGGSERSRTGK